MSLDLNPIEHLWDVVELEIPSMNVQLTNLQKLCDTIRSTWNKISKECVTRRDTPLGFHRHFIQSPGSGDMERERELTFVNKQKHLYLSSSRDQDQNGKLKQ